MSNQNQKHEQKSWLVHHDAQIASNWTQVEHQAYYIANNLSQIKDILNHLAVLPNSNSFDLINLFLKVLKHEAQNSEFNANQPNVLPSTTNCNAVLRVSASVINVVRIITGTRHMQEVNVNDHQQNVEVVHQSLLSDVVIVSQPLGLLEVDQVGSSEQLNVSILANLLEELSAQNLGNGDTVVVDLLLLLVSLVLHQVVEASLEELVGIELSLDLARLLGLALTVWLLEAVPEHVVVDVHDLGVGVSHVGQEVQQALVVHQFRIQQQLHVGAQVQDVPHSFVQQVPGDLVHLLFQD